ncbi:MAG TPA: sigma-54 dependent transcriptional regulator [bacterium]
MLSAFEILVVEDNDIVRETLHLLLKKAGFGANAVEDGPRALALMKQHYFDLVITDYMMDPMDGIELTREIKKNWPATDVLMITAYGTIPRGVEAMQSGANDYITKPFHNAELLSRIDRLREKRASEQQRKVVKSEIRQIAEFDAIVGESDGLIQVLSLVERVAHTNSTVLIYGESGTGKELIAQAIHHLSSRKRGPFLTVNCATITQTLQESELFGHVKGAFTGAIADKMGLLESANGGTLLLDEIAELAPSTQAALLRFLQNSEIRKVGDPVVRNADVRLIAATNKRLSDEVSNARFREDLFYRINVFPLSVPPLRERKEDIPLLARHFLGRYGSLYRDRAVTKVSKRAMNMLMNHDWPGNIRELENVLQRAIALSDSDEIGPQVLPVEVGDRGGPAAESHRGRNGKLAEVELEIILKTLKEMNGNRKKTAERLGISTTTLWRKLKGLS